MLYMENYGKYEKKNKIRITANRKGFLKYASRPTSISYRKFGKNSVVIHEKKNY